MMMPDDAVEMRKLGLLILIFFKVVKGLIRTSTYYLFQFQSFGWLAGSLNLEVD